MNVTMIQLLRNTTREYVSLPPGARNCHQARTHTKKFALQISLQQFKAHTTLRKLYFRLESIMQINCCCPIKLSLRFLGTFYRATLKKCPDYNQRPPLKIRRLNKKREQQTNRYI